MTEIVIKANAKINLCLHITKIRQDGYHEIDSVFQNIDLFDLITIKKAKNVRVGCDAPFVQGGQKNICFKAAEIFIEKTGILGAEIKINKNIPVSSGMGGGSADGAAVIRGLNILFDCGIKKSEEAEMAREVGADVPFFLTGGCCRASGIGEILSPLSQPFDHDIVIIKPNAGVSTPMAYRLFDERHVCGGSAAPMVKAMEEINETAYLGAMENALEPCAIKLVPEAQQAISALILAGAKKARVTGSGAAVFGIFKSGEGKHAVDHLKKAKLGQVFLTKKTNAGIEFISRLTPGP